GGLVEPGVTRRDVDVTPGIARIEPQNFPVLRDGLFLAAIRPQQTSVIEPPPPIVWIIPKINLIALGGLLEMTEVTRKMRLNNESLALRSSLGKRERRFKDAFADGCQVIDVAVIGAAPHRVTDGKLRAG